MSDTVGYVLLAAAAIPAVFGWDLSRRGLAKVDQAAERAREVATQAHDAISSAQPVLASADPQEASVVAQQTSQVVEKTDALTTGLADVSEALKAMTGVFAPARVFLAMSVVLILAALVALDVVAVTLGAA